MYMAPWQISVLNWKWQVEVQKSCLSEMITFKFTYFLDWCDKITAPNKDACSFHTNENYTALICHSLGSSEHVNTMSDWINNNSVWLSGYQWVYSVNFFCSFHWIQEAFNAS